MSSPTRGAVCLGILLTVAANPSTALMRKIPIPELRERAHWIVIGRVGDVTSVWNPDRTMIYSRARISVQDWIKGTKPRHELVVRTEGGRVGRITCYVSDEPCFATGERVLLFLEPDPDSPGTQKVIGLFQGKYTIKDERIVENGLALSDFMTRIRFGGKGKTPFIRAKQVSTNIKIEDETVALPAYVYGESKWPDNSFPIRYYINEDGFSDCSFDEYQAIQRVGHAWEQVPGAYFALCYAGTTTTSVHSKDGVNTITFEILGDPRGKAYIWAEGGWIYECDMVFNDALPWMAASSNSCQALHLDVESVAVHEFGHWLYLKHSDVVGATMSGGGIAPGATWPRTLALDDMDGIRSIYPHPDGVPKPQPGCWPWTPGLMNNFTSAVLVDMDRDGVNEVVVGAIGDANGVWAINGDRSLDWEDGLSVGTLGGSVPASADLDGDNWEDVIIGSTDGKVYARGRKDTAVQGWPINVGSEVHTAPAVGNIDGQAGLEVVVGADNGKVYAWNSNGAILDRDGLAPWDWPQSTGGAVRSSPALGDLNGDGKPDVVVGSDDGNVYAWDYTGTALAGWPKATANQVRSCPALGDIDGDNELEIVVGSDNGKVYAWNADGTVVDRDGVAPWDWPKSTGGMVRSSPALGDLDEDGYLDIVVGSDDSKIHAWDHTGTALAGWPVTTGGAIRSSPVIGDIDGDNKLEVLVGSNDNKLYGLNHNGSPAAGWPVSSFGPIQTTPVLGDIDGNGELEVCVAMASNQWVNSFMCRDLGSPYHLDLLPWPVFGHDRYHTSVSGYSPPPVIPLPRVDDIDPGWGNDEWGSGSNGCPLPGSSTSTYTSPPYSLEIRGSGAYNDFAWLQSRDVNISFTQPYQVRFNLRMLNYYHTKFFDFGHVKLLLESPTTPMQYDSTGNDNYQPIGPPVGGYLPLGTWIFLEIDVNPSMHEYTVVVNGFPVGIAHYSPTLSGSPALYLEDGPETGSILEVNYDDFLITGTVLSGLPFGVGDFDGDADVDTADFAFFQVCASGPGIPYSPGCEDQDFDGDNDIDQDDFAVFQRCYTGENNPAKPSCFE